MGVSLVHSIRKRDRNNFMTIANNAVVILGVQIVSVKCRSGLVQ